MAFRSELNRLVYALDKHTILVQHGSLHMRIYFRDENNLTMQLLLVTSFINRIIKGILSIGLCIVPSEPDPAASIAEHRSPLDPVAALQMYFDAVTKT